MSEQPHKPHKRLLDEIVAAKKQVQLGVDYAHYKDSAKVYQPRYFATLEANDVLCVVYQAQYGDKLFFVRPLSEWIETVEWQGRAVPRFLLVSEL